MASKIGGFDSSNQAAALGAGRAAQRPQDTSASGAQSSNASGGGSSENVQITGAARQLSNLEQTVKDMPAVNSAKVAQISSAIEQGTYSVDSHNIADKLMQMDKELAQLPAANDADTEAAPE